MASRRAAGVQSWEEQRGGLLTAPPPLHKVQGPGANLGHRVRGGQVGLVQSRHSQY